MTLDDLSNLDPQNIGGWPLPVKIVLIAVVCALIGYGAWAKDVQPQLDSLATVEKEEITLKETFEVKLKKAANLKALKDQLAEMKQSFGDMIRQLPDQTEVAGLIVDISQTGLAAGLEFELFKPGAEKPAEFYSELPISIRVVGDYHQFGEFVLKSLIVHVFDSFRGLRRPSLRVWKDWRVSCVNTEQPPRRSRAKERHRHGSANMPNNKGYFRTLPEASRKVHAGCCIT